MEYNTIYTRNINISRIEKESSDAQCRDEGMVNLSHPRAFKYWSFSRIQKFYALQINMISAVYNIIKEGGTLVYATCTFAPEENEVVIDHLLKRFINIRIEPIIIDIPNRMPGLTKWQEYKLSPSLKDAMRIIPLKITSRV